jgi:hypothetical protein
MDDPAIEPRSLQGKTRDEAPELWHGQLMATKHMLNNSNNVNPHVFAQKKLMSKYMERKSNMSLISRL